MTFFKNFLSKASRTLRKTEPAKRRKTLIELFKLDFKQLPDESYEESRVYVPELKSDMPVFFKKLDYKECGLFDHVELIKFSDDDFNVTFTTHSVADINTMKLIKLVDRLHGIFGADAHGKKTFTVQDFTMVQEGFWPGRIWPGEELSGTNKTVIFLAEAKLQFTLVLSRVKLISSSNNPERLMNLL